MRSHLNGQNEQQCIDQLLLETFNCFNESFFQTKCLLDPDNVVRGSLVIDRRKRSLATFSTLDNEFVNLLTSPFIA